MEGCLIRLNEYEDSTKKNGFESNSVLFSVVLILVQSNQTAFHLFHILIFLLNIFNYCKVSFKSDDLKQLKSMEGIILKNKKKPYKNEEVNNKTMSTKKYE